MSQTILRVKRKHTQESFKSFLVADSSKKMRVEEAKVFSLFQSGPTIAHEEELNKWREMHRENKRLNDVLDPVQDRKELLSSRKLLQAKHARFKVVHDRRNTAEHNQEEITIVDLERDQVGLESSLETDDPVQEVVDAMVNAFIAESNDEYVYDYYLYDDQTPVARALEAGLVATCEMENVYFLREEVSDSDKGSDDDSNAEDYYQNDYPEEDSEEERQIWATKDYNSQESQSESQSDHSSESYY
jgi:hypothetical protein